MPKVTRGAQSAQPLKNEKAQIARDLSPGTALNGFINPQKPRTYGDLAKDGWDVVRGAVVDEVIIGSAKNVAALATGAYRLVRPGRQAEPLPPEVDLATPSRTTLSERTSSELTTVSAPAAVPAARGAEPNLLRLASLNAAQHRRTGQRFDAGSFRDPEIAEAAELPRPATAEDIARQLARRDVLNSNTPNAVAVLRPQPSRVSFSLGKSWKKDVDLPFQVASREPLVAKLVAAALHGQELPRDFELGGNTTLAVRLRGPAFQTEVADKVMALGKVDEGTRANGERVAIDEQVFFPIFDALMRRGAAGLGSGAKIGDVPLADFLANAHGVEFKSNNEALNRLLNDGIRRNTPEMNDLRMRLALLEVAKRNYFENADVKGATTKFLAGTIIGMLGELAIEFLPSKEIAFAGGFDPVVYPLNVVFGGLVDGLDNYKGRMGAVALGAANLDAATLAQQKTAAVRASVFGATYGTLVNVLAQFPLSMTFSEPPLSNRLLSTGILAAGTVGSILGASLSIPFQMKDDETRKTATVVGLLKRGIVSLPEKVVAEALKEVGVEETEPKTQDRLAQALIERYADVESGDVPFQSSQVIRSWALDQAQRDMSMSIGSKSSTYGFFMAPLLSLGWGLNLIPNTARALWQSILFGASPGAENMSTAAIAAKVTGDAGSDLHAVAELACAMAVKGSDAPELDASMRAEQAHRPQSQRSLTLARALTGLGSMNYWKQPSLL